MKPLPLLDAAPVKLGSPWPDLRARPRGHQVAFQMILDDLRECGMDESLRADLLRQMRSFEHTSAELEKRILKLLEETNDPI